MGIIKLKSSQEKVEKVEEQMQEMSVVDTEDVKQWDDAAILREDETRTDEYSRHYVLNNGTAKTVICAEAVNYYDDEEQKWKQIDNTLVEKEDVFESKHGKVKTEISKVKKGRKVKISKGEKAVAWEFVGKKSFIETLAVNDKKTELKVKACDNLNQMESKAVYENVEKGTDLEYVLKGNNLKENIVVREKSADYRYLFALKTEGLKIRLAEDNRSLELYSEIQSTKGDVETRVEFVIPSPYMYDAAGNTSDEVYYELEEDVNGNCQFSVVANDEWINDENRVMPVTIDPQIVTSVNDVITKKTFKRTISTDSSSGTTYGSWVEDSSSSDIKVSKSSTLEYKTDVTIKKSIINLLKGKISGVYLNLDIKSSIFFWANVKINGTTYEIPKSADFFGWEIDITHIFRNAINEVVLEFTHAFDNLTFSNPKISIEYLVDEHIQSTKKSFNLAGVATGEVDLATGNMTTIFNDVKPVNSVMGIGIYHIHKRSMDDYHVGECFRLNLHESLVRNSANDYIYTDEKGDKHGFIDYYYYIDKSGVKTYIQDRSNITVDAEGALSFVDGTDKYNVVREYKSTAGLKAMTTMEGVANVEWLEQRSDEIKQNQEKIDSYENVLKEFVWVSEQDISDGDVIRKEVQIDYQFNETFDVNAFETFLNNESLDRYLMNKAEYLQYRALKMQKNAIVATTSNAEIIPGISGLKKQLLSLDSAIYELTYKLQQYTNNFDNSDETKKNNIKNALESGECISKVDYDLINEAYEKYTRKYINRNGGEETPANAPPLDGATLKEMIRQRNLLLEQRKEAEGDLNQQESLLNEQIMQYEERKSENIEAIKKYYKEYVALLKEKERLARQTPINFLTDGHIIKGYNANGDLVAIYDRYDNYAVVEYETYFVGEEEKTRIARLYDNTEKQVLFSYNEAKDLVSITDTRGKKTRFTYTDEQLTNVTWDSGENLDLTYDENNISSLVEKKNGLKTNISYSNNRPEYFYCYTTNKKILPKGETESEDKHLLTTSISYTISSSTNTISNVIITEDTNVEYYTFDADGNCTTHCLKEDGLYTKAEQYEYTPYWIGDEQQENPKRVIKCAKKVALYASECPTDDEDFDIKTTTLDQFNNPVQMTASAVKVNADGTNTKTSTVDYIYDDNQKLVQEKTTVLYSNPSKEIISYKKYNYNAYGDIIRTESYIEGEEYTKGKTIEEMVYDKKGNVVKSFTYNTLDSSSKFYMQTEYDETGKVLAEYDETGENKTQFGYIDGTGIVNEETLANGSKFAYGRDIDDGITAITQSTDEGEENSTQKVYTYGMLTEVRSGNNVIQYSYDYSFAYADRVERIHYNDTSNYVVRTYSEIPDETCCCKYMQLEIAKVNGETATIRADKRGNIISRSYNDGSSVSYTYDTSKGDLLKKILQKQNTLQNRTFEYTYDNLNNLQTYEEKKRNTTMLKETYTYNEFSQVNTLTQSTGTTYAYTYKDDSSRTLENIKINVNVNIKPKLDVYGRNKGKEIYIGTNKVAEEQIVYRKVGDHATNMPATIRYGHIIEGEFVLRDSIKYAYDKMGNIIEIYENGKLFVTYEYDKLNRLVRENNSKMKTTKVFAYDNNGNIILQEKYDYTMTPTSQLGLAKVIKEYCYQSASDQLLKIITNILNDDNEYVETTESFFYDAIGNSTVYRGQDTSWEKNGRLTLYGGNTFTYDVIGRRLSKNAIDFTYDSQGRVVKQDNGLEFFYDQSGLSGFIYNANTYFYRKDVQGNIIAILDSTGTVVVEYAYDAWGNNTIIEGSDILLATMNPFRYRGYYYDEETGLYFLKTRYYDPEIGRFVSIDGIEYLDPETINGLNLYAYCNNNPVMNIDPNGTWSVKGFLKKAGAFFGGLVATTVGTFITLVSLPFGFIPGTGVITQSGISMASYGAFMMGAAFDEGIYADMSRINWNPFNANANLVLESNKVSFYKGVPVIKYNGFNNSSLSAGIIFLDKDWANVDTLNHEWGHNVQLWMLGLSRYAYGIALPSLIGSGLSSMDNKVGQWLDENYYNLPWERSADFFGGVTGRHKIKTLPISLVYFFGLLL